ncbi:MAG: methyltransferase domain-containing protein, partial [FCB group bacterium]
MSYQNDLSEAWNNEALQYDVKLNGNSIFNYMRQQSLVELKNNFQNCGKILELGCGTGDESIELAKQGINVYSIDISKEMISLATIKSENLGLDKNCTFKVLPIEEIDSIKEKFDGAFSSFGPLNCIDDMEIFAKNISKLINKGGIFIASVMNKYCIAEVLNYTIRLQFKRAFRRFGKQPKTISLNDNSISFKCFYYSFKKFYKYFKSDFELINIIALP